MLQSKAAAASDSSAASPRVQMLQPYASASDVASASSSPELSQSHTAASDVSTESSRSQVSQSQSAALFQFALDSLFSQHSISGSGDQVASQQASASEALTGDSGKGKKAVKKIDGEKLLAAFARSGSKDSEDIPFSFTCSITMVRLFC